MDQYRTLEGKKATIIPSPARRESRKGLWVFPEVPMGKSSEPKVDVAVDPAWKQDAQETSHKELN